MSNFDNVRRAIIHHNVKKANVLNYEEIAYNEFGDYEIVTQKHFKKEKTYYSDGNEKEYFATYLWYAVAGVKLLEKYDTLSDATKGHLKWCQKEFDNEI